MKFTSLFAILGAASARAGSARVPASGYSNNTEPHVYVESPCDKIESQYGMIQYQMDMMRKSCGVSNWQQTQSSQANNYSPCAPAQYSKWSDEMNTMEPQREVCRVKRDQRHFREMGVDVESPSQNHTDGEIHFSTNWQNLTHYAEQWGNWFEGEAQSKEAQEIAMHLNSAAKRMVNTVAARQAAAVRNAGRLVHAYTQWAEPGASCDADAYVQCLQNNTRPGMIRPGHVVGDVLYGNCTNEYQCEIMNGTNAQYQEYKNASQSTQHALEVMAHEVQQDVMGEMSSQEANARHIVQDFLTEARERYTAWGCDPECTDRHTRSLDRLDGMKHCNCPASITVSGDTSIILG